MTTYVIDSYGLAAIGELVDASKLKDVQHVLTDLAMKHELRYPAAVWRECCEYMDEHTMGLWAKTAFGHLPKDKSTYAHELQVTNEVFELVDPDATENQTQVEVAKMAVWLIALGLPVVVVTDDNRTRPDRMSLDAACQQMGMTTYDAASFLDEVLPFAL